MKKVIIMVLVIGISLPALAQKSNNLFEKLTEKYAEQDGFSASMLTNDMFELYMRKKNVDETSEVAAALDKLDNILVISQSNLTGPGNMYFGTYTPKTDEPQKQEKADLAKEVHSTILSHYKSSNYSLLKTEKRMGEDVKVYLKKFQDKINAIALVTNSSVATNLVELQGNDIDLSNIASLNKALNLRGLENLYKIDNNSSGWAPSYFGGNWEAWDEDKLDMLRGREYERAMRLSEEQIREFEKQAQLSEEQIQKIEQQAQMQAQKQAEMAEKYRQMAEQYGRQPIFLSTPGDTNTIYYINGEKVKPEKVKEFLKRSEVEQISKTKDDKEGKTIIRITTK